MVTPFVSSIRPALDRLIERRFPGFRVVDVRRFGVDEAEPDAVTEKAVGYGHPLKLRIRDQAGAERHLVFHTASSDPFGHDRRSDRAAEMLLGFDTFGSIPRHVPALDVGAISADQRELISLAQSGEFYLLTGYADGHLYADELRRIAADARLGPHDLDHCRTLAGYLADLHAHKLDAPEQYSRAVRDLVGSGEGIFGMIDSFADGAPGARAERLIRIESACVAWRHRLRRRPGRLSRTHGDFHPFNLLFDDAHGLHLLDTSRGSVGDPADDICALAINYLFFAVERPAVWRSAFAELWHTFFERYLERSGDAEMLEVLAPFLAWRGLVVTSPVWYPGLQPAARDRLLSFIEKTLAADRFEPAFAEDVFA